MEKFELKRAVKVLPLAMGFALVAGNAQALGLGTLEVKSQLNQPLVAEIPLIGVDAGELDALSVRLASPEAFERVGLPPPGGVTANLQFSVGRNARGEPVVRVTTSNRVDAPFVAFLMEADWGKGSVVREFTALIDPPHIAAATVTPMTAPAVSVVPAPTALPPAAAPPAAPEPGPSEALIAEEPITAAALPEAPEPAPAPPPAPPAPPAPPPAPIAVAQPEPAPLPAPIAVAQPEPAPAPPPAPLPAPAAATDRREVQEGDTLWRIAQQNRQGATAAQMMLAIQRANPDAFLRENINLLRKGAVLRIPTPEDATDLAREAAEAQVREQMQAWRATQPAPAPVQAPSEGMASAPSRSTAPRASVADATDRPPAQGARLEIAPPSGAGAAGAQSGAASGGSGSELRAELEQAREDLSARDAELRELQSRLTEQEALANEQKRLIELKDSQLSALEESLRQQRIDNEAGAEPVTEAAAPAAAAPAAAAPAAAAPAAAAPAAAPTAAAPAAAPVADAGTSWFRNPLVIGGGALLLVGGLVALLRRRRGADTRRPLPTVPATGGGRLSEDADFLSQLPNPSAAGTTADEVERAEAAEAPPARADRDPEPAAAEPSPTAAASELEGYLGQLRRHYNAGDSDAFLRTAEQMRVKVSGPTDPRWREVVVMGMGLVPGHALFREVQWNPIKAGDVHTRAPTAEAPRPAASPSPEAPRAPFSERETAERPAVELPPVEDSGMDDTRLELAKAYIEIGDADGARGMLEEVLAEGGSAARAEAERLLKQLG